MLLAAGGALAHATVAHAAVVEQSFAYADGDTPLEGYVAYDDAISGARPGVLVIHQWMGLTDYEKMRCRMLAELGYVAFAADVYGKGVRPTTMEGASAEAGKYYGDRALLRHRVGVALEWLAGKHDPAGKDGGAFAHVDHQKVAAIGYCFGGGAALELARSGADLAGVVSFHGSLDTPDPADAKNIRCPLLVLHGADDPYVPTDKVEGFIKEMRDAQVDYQVVLYSGAVHSFTLQNAGDDPSKGAAYNAKADARSWIAMKAFFAEIFGSH
ncbi:MAG: dienelactone hydrolase family protein [Candidatus Eisenbacteria bacterium]|uniref:Dienelactone hydrolase family protein n=1 Tax=Eiseniibacteriota bacterium TaxID=2212470 RepID=A0A956LWJ6_UNCEI|nr:dienelactone hydrolase family protein [Candidatus Eisenbacteria bacterium]